MKSNLSSSETLLKTLFSQHYDESPLSIEPITGSGGPRNYYRISGKEKSCIGVYGSNIEENQSFFYLTQHFKNAKVPVPTVLKTSPDGLHYIQNDLGRESLLEILMASKKEEGPSGKEINLYKKTLSALAHLHMVGSKDIDYSKCYQGPEFSKEQIIHDLNYFLFYFLRNWDIPYDQGVLMSEFEQLASFLTREKPIYFMVRDFQARNVMVQGETPYFIDYQGGRRGYREYDLASILFQSRAELSSQLRTELKNHYLQATVDFGANDLDTFEENYPGFVFIRILQTMGAYGFRGLIQKKDHFIKSIPPALENLRWFLQTQNLPIKLPELTIALHSLIDAVDNSFRLRKNSVSPESLTLRVQSFSYKKEIPQDPSGNGGGFIFDCRGIHNPGRYEEYKRLTGRDQPVKDFFKEKSDIDQFIQNTISSTESTVKTYLERGFSHLMISFGCTGGQHRSVFSADAVAAYYSKNYPVKVILTHLVQEEKNWRN